MSSRFVDSALTLDTEVAWEEVLKEKRALVGEPWALMQPLCSFGHSGLPQPLYPDCPTFTIKTKIRTTPSAHPEVSGARQKRMGEVRAGTASALGVFRHH